MKQYTKDLGKVCVTTGGIYNSGESYEILTIVYDEFTNKSYLSRQDIPVGIDINNKEYWQCIGSGKTSDDKFINLSYLDEAGNVITYKLADALKKVNIDDRKVGAILTFYEVTNDITTQPSWSIYQFNSLLIDDWENTEVWKNLYYNRNKFVGWFDSLNELKEARPRPYPGDYAYVGTNFQNSTIYKCYDRSAWKNTKQLVQDFLQMVISGDLDINYLGNWTIKGRDTGVSAVGVKEVTTSLDVLAKRTKPTVKVEVTDIPENLSKKLNFAFGIPVPVDAKITVVTATAKSLDKRSQPTVKVTNSGEADDTHIAFEFGIPLPVDANISNVTATATQLGEGQRPTAKVTKSGAADDTRLNFTFGIPKGDKGDTGEISSVSAEATGLDAGSDPTVSVKNTGTATESQLKFNFGIPKGDKGDTGAAAGIGNCTATVQMVEETESPSCVVTTSGVNTAKQFKFAFKIPYKTSSVIQVVPTPSDATVKINRVEKKTETVTNGSQVTVNVSKSGYAEEEHIIEVNQDIIDRVNLIQIAPQKIKNIVTEITGDITDNNQQISSRGGNFKITLKATAIYYDGTEIDNEDVTDFVLITCNNENVIVNPHGNIVVAENNDKENNRTFDIKITYTNENNQLDSSSSSYTQSKNNISNYQNFEVTSIDENVPDLSNIPGHITNSIKLKATIQAVYEDDSTELITLLSSDIHETQSEASWCNIDNNLYLNIEDNDSGIPRSANINITTTSTYKSKTTSIEISQLPIPESTLDVNPTSIEIPATGGNQNITVTSNTEWSVS